MSARLRKLVCGLMTTTLLVLNGCQISFFTIAIPDFESKQVAGVWLWRLSPSSGSFSRDAQFVFDESAMTSEGERLDYLATNSDGSSSVPMQAIMKRDGENPDRVTLQLVFWRTSEPGQFRASTFNAAGESPLSAEIVSL